MAALPSAFTAANRLLTLTFAPDSGLGADAVLPYELSDDDGLSRGYTYTLTCLSPDIFLKLKHFIGAPAQLALLTDDGAARPRCGIVTAFLTRWLAQEGISWYIEHGDAGIPGAQPLMTLILFDDVAVLQPASAAKVRFHRADGTEAEDTITDWHATRTLQPGSIEHANYEYKAVVTNRQHNVTPAHQGDHGEQLAASMQEAG